MTSQKQAIKEHLQNFGSITSKEAWGKFGITRLSSLINRLRNDGLNIYSIEERGPKEIRNVLGLSGIVIGQKEIKSRFNWVRYKLNKQ